MSAQSTPQVKPSNEDNLIGASSVPKEVPDTVHADLAELIRLLKSQQAEDSGDAWYDRAYRRFKKALKYIGMPGVLIAAVIPVYNLSTALRDYEAKLFVRDQYSAYANTLLNAGELDRASKMMSELDAADKFDARSQYATAKLLTKIAIIQGKRQQEAMDRTNVLLLIQNRRPFYFPQLGGRDEILDLELALIDIQLQLQLFKQASAQIESLLANGPYGHDQVSLAQILMRRGTMHTLRFESTSAEQDLAFSVRVLTNAQKPAELAEATFQLAKVHQLTANDRKGALELYQRSREQFERLGERYGLIKVLNNMGMLYIDDQNYKMARSSFELEQRATIEIGDDEGLARTLINLAIVAREQGSLTEAVRLATEALGSFKEHKNKLGMAAAYQSLSNSHERLGELPEALVNARFALQMFEDIRDLRGVRGTMGVLANLSVTEKDISDAVFYFDGAIRLRDYLSEDTTSSGQQDTRSNLTSLGMLAERVGVQQYEQFAESADARLRDLFEQLGMMGISDLLNRRNLSSGAAIVGADMQEDKTIIRQ